MAWTVWACDTMTGVRKQRLPVDTTSWERVLNGKGSGQSTLQLLDELTAKLPIRELTEPVKTTVVVDRDGAVVYGGVVWSREYTRSSASLSLSHSDIRSILALRKALKDPNTWPVRNTTLAFEGVSLGTIAKKLVEAGMAGPNAALPMVLPPDEPGGPERSYPGYELPYVEELLENLSNVDDGPDIDFQPRWSTDTEPHLEWVMRVGTGTAPQLTDGQWEWNLQGTDAGLHSLTVKEEATKQSGRTWAVGEGSEESMLVVVQPFIPPVSDMPLLEQEKSYKTVKRGSTLDAHALADHNAYKEPIHQWGMSVLAGKYPKITTLQLGGTARVYIKDDPWLTDGWHDNRLIQFAGDLSENVQLQFTPIGGE